jgi:hypothetical protein
MVMMIRQSLQIYDSVILKKINPKRQLKGINDPIIPSVSMMDLYKRRRIATLNLPFMLTINN